MRLNLFSAHRLLEQLQNKESLKNKCEHPSDLTMTTCSLQCQTLLQGCHGCHGDGRQRVSWTTPRDRRVN